MPKTLLTAVIDDDEDLREALCELLSSLQIPCRPYCDGATFLASHDWSSFGCIISDLRMPIVGGIQLVQALTERSFPIPVIIITSHISEHARARALAAGARAILLKPFSQTELVPLVQGALANAEKF